MLRNSLIPGKGKSKKVTLRESGIISINYPEPFLLGEVSKRTGKELGHDSGAYPLFYDPGVWQSGLWVSGEFVGKWRELTVQVPPNPPKQT